MKCLKSFFLIILLFSISFAANAQNWASLDAVVYNSKADKYFFFFGKYFVVKERGQYIDGLPLLISEEWESFPKSWGGGYVDAVCYSSDNDKYYFFKGDEVAETQVTSVNTGLAGTYKIALQKLSKPVKINSKEGFPGIPWSSIDAATYNTETNTYYFFKGEEFVSKKRGEPVDPKIKNINAPGGFVNLAPQRPIKAVDYSADNKAYYFFWDEYYMTKVQGEDIKSGTQPKRYEGSGEKAFEWAERSNNNFVGLANESGYLANFRVSWKSGGKSDSWSKKGVALTYEKRLALPKNATDITITAYVYDALKDDKNGPRIFSDDMGIPPNKWFKVYGTVFDPKYKIDKKATNIVGSVKTYFTKDVANAVSDAGKFFEDNFEETQYQTVKLLAKAEGDKRVKFMTNFGDAAAKVATDQAFIQSLLRVAKAKDPKLGADVMKTLVNRPEWAEVKKALEFKSMSVGFTSGASAVIGMEGAFGYGVAIAAPNKVKGYAGLDGSLGVQSGLGLGLQFGIWKNPPDQLSGNSVAVNVEVGSGVGVSFSVVYDVTLDANNAPVFTFSGIVVTPGVGAGMGASLGTGYSWVF
jgi:hypothetical protein